VLFLESEPAHADELSRRTVDHNPVYPRRWSAGSSWRDRRDFGDNHPSGDPTPSQATFR